MSEQRRLAHRMTIVIEVWQPTGDDYQLARAEYRCSESGDAYPGRNSVKVHNASEAVGALVGDITTLLVSESSRFGFDDPAP